MPAHQISVPLAITLSAAALAFYTQSAAARPTPSQWQGDAPGNYFDPTRWSGPIPDGPDAQALFGPSNTPRQITLDQNVHLANLTFDSNSPYTLSGPNTLDVNYIQNPLYEWSYTPQPRIISVLRGSHTIDSPISGSATNEVKIASGAFLSVTSLDQGDYTINGGGTLVIKGPFTPRTFNLTDSSSLVIDRPAGEDREADNVFPTDISVIDNIDAGSKLIVASDGAPQRVTTAARVNIGTNAGKITLESPRLPASGPLAIQFIYNPNCLPDSNTGLYQGSIDISNGIMTMMYANIPDLTAMVRAGYGNGTWSGTGITSSLAGPNGPTGAETLAILSVTDCPPIASITDTYFWSDHNRRAAVIYTYLGDTNGDGIVDDTDLAHLQEGLASNGTLTGWSHGDFNYDNQINADDLALFNQGLSHQGRPLGLAALIPEPSSLAFAPTPLLALLRRTART